VLPLAPVPLLAEASTLVIVLPRAFVTVRPISPVMTKLVAAAVVNVAMVFTELPSDFRVRVSTPATVRVDAPDRLLTVTVAESAFPVTSLNATT